MNQWRSSIVRRDSEGSKKEVQLRVIPTELRFVDAVCGKAYRQNVIVHNVGQWNQKIRFVEPLKPQFKLLLNSLDKELASGLQMTAMIEYRPDKNEDTFDQMFVSAGNKMLEIPLIGLIPTCELEMVPVVDFGTIVANSKVHCKEINIINNGKASGMFKTEYQGQLPIVISPTNGIVKAKSSKIIKVDFCADQPRIVNEVARINLQGRPETFLNIKVHVVEQIVELFNPSTNRKLECIHFGFVFFGTSKIEYAVLYNNSPETINWVAILQDDCVGEELGANIHQRTDIALNDLPYLNKIKKIDLTDFVSCIPNEGTLLPYEKIVITFCFSPKLVVDVKKDVGPAYRQDYALFVRFDSVGSKDGFLRDDNATTMKSNKLQKAELALTGTGLPVILHFNPAKVLHFAPCYMGGHSDILCVVQNRSISLPVVYRFRKAAHFKMDPERGKIDEGCIQNVICSFVPHQIGSFKVKQVIEILGPVADDNLKSLSMKPFYTMSLEFHCVCKAITKHVGVKINTGISPLVSNPTIYCVIKSSSKKEEENPPAAAMLQSTMTKLHNHHLNEETTKKALIAFPNDRAGSIRCRDRHKYFRTIFTKIPRHDYLDPDFEYTDLEKIRRKINRDYYTEYINNLRSVRLLKEAQKEGKFPYGNKDKVIEPSSGIKSPQLSQSEIKEQLSSSLMDHSMEIKRLLSTKKIANKETESLQRKVLKELKSSPSTQQEKYDCSIMLTPKKIHQIIVGPSVLNFGDICVKSANTQLLHIVNMLPMHILVQLDINLEELQKTKQFSYVIPPSSSTHVSLIFESSTVGKFWKSFTFRVNNVVGGHILVMAVVLPVKLELSTKELVLRPQTFSLKTCFQGTVRLYNRLNVAAQFEWKPVTTLKGISFSIHPAKGIVDAYCSLECEVTWQPGFSSPDKGEFILEVIGGNTLTLKCSANIGHTKVTFLEPQILFCNCAQGITTWRKAILHNIGQNHAYYKVSDQSLLPTMSIIPSEGVIPYGGIIVLNISCTPTVAEKIDTRAKRLVVDVKKDVGPAYRQDYALFVRFDSVGSKDGFLRDDNATTMKSNKLQKAELALTGTGLPVILHFNPAKVLHFAPCYMGGHSDILCVVQNRSISLPVVYRFRKAAHFKMDPERGKIDEGCIQNVICSFVPHQIGSFKVKQVIEILGPVADDNLKSLSMKPFYTMSLEFHCVCKAITKHVGVKINTGISPLVSNPTIYCVIKSSSKKEEENPPAAAMLQSTMTKLHNHHLNEETTKKALIAFPNDRAGSIRCRDRHKYFRTIFTKIPRHDYLDPDFEYTDLEKIRRKINRDYYTEYINNLRSVRLLKEAQKEGKFPYGNKDKVIEPSSGIKSPQLSQSEIKEQLSSSLMDHSMEIKRLLSTKKIANKETESLQRKVLKELKSSPSTQQEKYDCSIMLTPKKIHQIIVGPSVLNFGDICVKSANTQLLHIVNMLPMHILVQLDINLEELQKTKQFSYVIPPSSSTHVSLIFESSTVGKFWKSFTFRVNNVVGGHILVMAVVLPVKLELSTKELVLRPQTFSLKTCFQGTVRLYNRLNVAAQFEWKPVTTLKGISFSIHPAKGIVDAYCSLECEVTWQPGFSSPDKGEFILEVIGGNTLTLKCSANIGHTKVTFLEPQILFCNCAQGITTWRKAILHNIGQNHAYYKVSDQSLLPTMSIIPSEGVIPYGGIIVLNISCTPTVAEKIDTRAKVAIHHANMIDLRIGGNVEIPDIEIKPTFFQFTGAYVGTTAIIPFVIVNKGVTRARVEFNLQGFPLFSMYSKEKPGECTDNEFPYIYAVEVRESTSLECGMTFSPNEVATYDFSFQVKINSFNASEMYSEYLSQEKPLKSKTTPLISPCHVQATALRPPLELSKTKFLFLVPLHELDNNKEVTKIQDLVLHNITKKPVWWSLDVTKIDNLFKNGIFRFTALIGCLKPGETYTLSIHFCASKPISYTADVPMRLNDNLFDFRTLKLIGEIQSPVVLFDPPFICFTPVPLNTTTGVDFRILPKNYFSNSILHFKIPTAKLLDNDEIQPLSVTFPKGRVIAGSSTGVNDEILCHLTFKSSKPVSFFSDLLFCDDKNNWFSLPVSATAENCILTIYLYLAVHLDRQKIILRTDTEGNTMMHRGSFMIPRILKQSHRLLSSGAIRRPSIFSKFNEAEFTRGNLFVGMEIMQDQNSDDSLNERADTSLDSEEKNLFFAPEEGSKAYDYFLKVVNAVQTWFSLFGWPEGPHTLLIPETIRRDVQKLQFYSPNSTPNKYPRQYDLSKYNKTIYDVVLHLSGKLPPGINSSQSLPVDNVERVMQLHSQHSSLLDFITAQGGCISHILPEFLFEPEDYKKWLEIITSTPKTTAQSSSKVRCFVTIDINHFEAWSKWAWTDVFLQIYKVLILSQVVPHCCTSVPPVKVQNTPKINPCFASSNIYSNSERILLSWLNTNYESNRQIIWKNCHQDDIPPERWIVNFDTDLFDGLVFATQLAAYCPFLIGTHLANMYTRPKRPEQYLHNCLIIINSLREIGFELNIQAIDICDPNPILMLMLCVYMYERLPMYLPKKVVSFSCTLYDIMVEEILVKNPSLKHLVYTATIVGRDADNFALAQTGNVVTISPKKHIVIQVKFTSRFLHPSEATLLLISKSKGEVGGSTMAFALKGEVHRFRAIEVLKCNSPCYQWKEVTVNVKNPFPTAGNFSVILVESTTFSYLASQVTISAKFPNPQKYLSGSEYANARNSSYAENGLRTSIKSNFIREFFCSTQTLFVEAKGSSSLELFYLPFDIHVRYCAIILSNKEIGDLIYVLEGIGMIPLPSKFPIMKPPAPIDYTISPQKDHGKEDPVLYVSCQPRQVLDMDLKLPLTNESKEKALAFAAQQQMSTVEYERRLITGTLESSTIRVAIALLGLTKIECLWLFNMSKLKKPKSILYASEISLPGHFNIPKKIFIPQIPDLPLSQIKYQEEQPKSISGDLTSQKLITRSQTVSESTVTIPLQFAPLGAGRYPCKILLVSRYDVRVYVIEGIVNEEEPEAQLFFKTPAFEALTQRIPLRNSTKKPWKFNVTIEGDWFSGPPIVHIDAGETKQYPLTFKPILECEIMGKLILQNELDGMTHIVKVVGIGQYPLPLDKIILDCQVGTITDKSLIIPNYTKSLLTFKISSDLSIVWGDSQLTIDPDKSAPYIIHVCPWKRGIFTDLHRTVLDIPHITVSERRALCIPRRNQSAVTFSVKPRDEEDSQEDTEQEKEQVSSQGTPSEPSTIIFEEYSDDKVKSFKIWFHLEIHSSPGPPIETFELHCISLETICIQIPISNPKEYTLHMDVQLTTIDLSGPNHVDLKALEGYNYFVWYSPASTGYKEESVIFQPDTGEEFWYLLKLTTEVPKIRQVPEMQCELGKNISQTIPLYNPTHDTLELYVSNSNPENFVIETDRKFPMTLLPRSTIKITIHFYPSALGRAGHETCISFNCTQFKEWRFYLYGVGLYPKPIDIERVSTVLGLQASVMIRFRNPTSENVAIDLILTNKEKPKHVVLDDCWDTFLSLHPAFQFNTLKNTQGIIVAPKEILDIPVLFSPGLMTLYKTLVIIKVKRANKKNWPIDNFDQLSAETKRIMGAHYEEIQALHWIHPIVGLPQASLPRNPQTVVRCQANKRVEEKVEVEMFGHFFGPHPSQDATDFLVFPKRTSYYAIYEDTDVSQRKRQFEYELEFANDELRTNLESTVSVYLHRKHFNVKYELITLIFKVVFAPRKPFTANITLKVESMTDGLWKFPITLIATEPEVEDVINIQGIGLFKTSVTEFTLTSKTRYYEEFIAYFLPGGEQDFFVKPTSGILPPFYTKGVVIVVGFKPRMYSKKYQAILVIQTDEIYWLYEINGLPPSPSSYTDVKAKVNSTNENYGKMTVIPHNFIRENAKLRITGPSSPTKGADLVKKKK